jgi:hypothetical protein
MAQLVQRLPSKHQTLSSGSSTTKMLGAGDACL